MGQTTRCEGTDSPGAHQMMWWEGDSGEGNGNCRDVGVATQAGERKLIKCDDIKIQQDDR